MKSKLLIITFLLVALSSFSQQITYKSGGNILDSKNDKMSPTAVRALLSKNTDLLNLYNAGRTKKTVGNIFFYGGLGLIVTDLANGAFNDIIYPTALTYIGITCVVVSIPVKIGYSKKIKTVVNDYNKQVVFNDHNLKIESINLVTNTNGLGFQITF